MRVYEYYVYIITNRSNDVLYVGVTSDLQSRINEHKLKYIKDFLQSMNVTKLVYYEEFQWIQDAIAREKQLKAGPRQKKVDLVISNNPSWIDLSAGWYN